MAKQKSMMDYMMSRVDPSPKGAKLKPSPVARKSEKEIKSTAKNAIQSLNTARAKKEATENKQIKRNRRAAAGIIGGMVGAAAAMYKENRRRNPESRRVGP